MKYVVTVALPYANGPLHLGHLVEHIQADIYVRALRMYSRDNVCFFLCGADSHGTPIEINAAQKGENVEEYVEQWRHQHQTILESFGILFNDGYRSTHCIENQKMVEQVFLALQENDDIETKEITQLYDDVAGRFLPDRYVKGTCPCCFANDQYGDVCEVCNSVYRSIDLLNPVSILSSSLPQRKLSFHYFFKLKKYTSFLQNWISNSDVFQPEIKEWLKHWFYNGIKDWDISRDAPYFGFKIPQETEKYFYVWLDAPIAYISFSKMSGCFDLWKNEEAKIIHFIGKDIVYFHSLFWPAILRGLEFKLPEKIYVHGMLTVNGVKMSKSKKTFILAEDFLRCGDPDYLRFYFASKLSLKIDDIDFVLLDFINKINADIVFSIVNLLSRVTKLISTRYCNVVGSINTDVVDVVKSLYLESFVCYFDLNTSQVIKNAITISGYANKYLQDNKPWSMLDQSIDGKAHRILSTALWMAKVCVGLLKPVLPNIARKVEAILNVKELTFENVLDSFDQGHIINEYKIIASPLKYENFLIMFK